jgi:hypothetical protein
MVKVNEIKDSLAADLIGFAFQQICNQGGESLSRQTVPPLLGRVAKGRHGPES